MPIRRISTELIDEVCGSIHSLAVLNLSHNEISTIENLERLTALTRLDLGHNRLPCISGLDALSSLTHLSLTSNRIRLVTGLENLRLLETLLLADNLIETPAELRTLAWLPALHTLTLAGNPLLASEAVHSAHVARLLPSLRLLDGENLRGGEGQARAAPPHPSPWAGRGGSAAAANTRPTLTNERPMNNIPTNDRPTDDMPTNDRPTNDRCC